MELKGAVVIVTGASQGIGREMAFLLATHGASVMLAARNEDHLRKVVEEIREQRGKAEYIQIDISNSSDVRRMIHRAIECFGRIDILVNNAAVTWFGKNFDDPDEEVDIAFRRIVETNLVGTWICTRYAVPYLKVNGGSIVNISSVHGHAGVPKSSAYAMSKGGILALTRSLAVELAPYNIRVNSISPGWIRAVEPGDEVKRTYGEEVAQQYLELFDDYEDDRFRLNQPLRRIGLPEDVAQLVLFLVSEKAKFINGADFIVDGGLTAMLAEPFRFDLDELWRVKKRGEEAQRWLVNF
ncbi:MAG: glucose 1-dehydrogenase [Thermoplasmata archaeon]|nr:glucose 1-dehydrogenase [Thermoplasmata archaeon]